MKNKKIIKAIKKVEKTLVGQRCKSHPQRINSRCAECKVTVEVRKYGRKLITRYKWLDRMAA